MRKNVFVLKKRIKTYWGGYSQCKYQYELIDECVESKIKFDYAFFLSGLDYPLWSNGKIKDFLRNNLRKEFIQGMNLTNCYTPPKMQTRVRLYHFRDLNIRNKFLYRCIYGCMREFLKCVHIVKKNYLIVDKTRKDVYCGSSWWCLSYDCIEYIHTVLSDKNNAYTKYFKTCLAPDELLIQTIVFNSRFKDKALLYEGDYPGLVNLTPLHYIEYADKIAVYSEQDFDKLISSGKMFCRKLQTGVSDKLIEMINNYRNESGN